MTRGKCISLYLIDGDVNGRIKCTLANWTGLVIKIPRTALDLCKDREELKQTGVSVSVKQVATFFDSFLRKNFKY